MIPAPLLFFMVLSSKCGAIPAFKSYNQVMFSGYDSYVSTIFILANNNKSEAGRQRCGTALNSSLSSVKLLCGYSVTCLVLNNCKEG